MRHHHNFLCCRQCRIAAKRDVILAIPRPCLASWSHRRAHMRGRQARIDQTYLPSNPYLGRKGKEREARLWWGGWYAADQAVKRVQGWQRLWSAGPANIDQLNNPHRYLSSVAQETTCLLSFERSVHA